VPPPTNVARSSLSVLRVPPSPAISCRCSRVVFVDTIPYHAGRMSSVLPSPLPFLFSSSMEGLCCWKVCAAALVGFLWRLDPRAGGMNPCAPWTDQERRPRPGSSGGGLDGGMAPPAAATLDVWQPPSHRRRPLPPNGKRESRGGRGDEGPP
jgi:hypothetical protein